jgi:hypothetical protein
MFFRPKIVQDKPGGAVTLAPGDLMNFGLSVPKQCLNICRYLEKENRCVTACEARDNKHCAADKADNLASTKEVGISGQTVGCQPLNPGFIFGMLGFPWCGGNPAGPVTEFTTVPKGRAANIAKGYSWGGSGVLRGVWGFEGV